MSQRYYVVNVTKEQYLHPHDFGEGTKLLEFTSGRQGTLQALALLLASSNGRGGGGDVHWEVSYYTKTGKGASQPKTVQLPGTEDHALIGSWAGDALVLAGSMAQAAALSADVEARIRALPPARLQEAGFYLVLSPGVWDPAKEEWIGRVYGGENPDFWQTLNLFRVAELLFENISARVVKLVAACEGPDHPLARLHLADGTGFARVYDPADLEVRRLTEEIHALAQTDLKLDQIGKVVELVRKLKPALTAQAAARLELQKRWEKAFPLPKGVTRGWIGA